ncbi:MAG: ATP-binding protein [Gammaproteobacteria bacterium]|nr:MAG: ATP-binding protein [Gammaproteobacteria bacterium]
MEAATNRIESFNPSKPKQSSSLELEFQRVRMLCSILERSRKNGDVENDAYDKLAAVNHQVLSSRTASPFWKNVCGDKLSLLEADVLAALIAPEIDPVIGWAYQRLQSNRSNYPSIALLVDLLGIDVSLMVEFYSVFERGSSLIRNNLIKRNDGFYEPLRLMPGVVQLLLGHSFGVVDLPGATLIENSFSWDDLVLPEDRRRMLNEYLYWVEYKDKVTNEWGGRKSGGPVALFSGPSGTGKTMAASIIANQLGFVLYKVDIGRLVSKYVGETEKNINSLFDAAEGRDVVLLFDEADSLFGKRGEIKESKDRYSNLEVSHLLARLETINTPTILTTNIRKNIDSAFLRRFQVVVEFPRPDKAARKDIWQKSLPKNAPIADEIDLQKLANISNLNGGNIKNAALYSAYLAAADNCEINYNHLATAVWREMAKDGREILASDLGELQEYLIKDHSKEQNYDRS